MSSDVAIWETRNLAEHVGLIKRQFVRSLSDGELRKLVTKIVTHTPDDYEPDRGISVPVVHAYGRTLRLPQLSAECIDDEARESQALWDFAVLNIAYTPDPPGYDLFMTTRYTLESGQGDCFPAGTLLLRDDGLFVPIEELEIGDRIHDGTRFVAVLKKWNRGAKEIVRVHLNNQSSLRLTPSHTVLRVPKIRRPNGTYGPGLFGSEEEVEVGELRIDDHLLQPRGFAGGAQTLSPDDALLMSAYLAEGYTSKDFRRVGLAGVANRKGVREEVMRVLRARGVSFSEHEREIRFARSNVELLNTYDLGRTALHKRLPHLDWDAKTVERLLRTFDATDGGVQSNGANVVYSSISYELALQYRVLQRMLGRSTSLRRVDNHGGAGAHPIYRVMARVDDHSRPWAKVIGLHAEDEQSPTFDIMTESGRVYLPESDVVVRQCDDFVIALGSMHRMLGFEGLVARVVSTNAESWEHVYLLVGYPKRRPKKWVALDPTVRGALPGWQYEKITTTQDFPL